MNEPRCTSMHRAIDNERISTIVSFQDGKVEMHITIGNIRISI